MSNSTNMPYTQALTQKCNGHLFMLDNFTTNVLKMYITKCAQINMCKLKLKFCAVFQQICFPPQSQFNKQGQQVSAG